MHCPVAFVALHKRLTFVSAHKPYHLCGHTNLQCTSHAEWRDRYSGIVLLFHFVFMPGSRYDAAYDQVRRFVISQPVSERDFVGSHKSEHLNVFPPLSCPSATKSLRRSLLRTRPCMSTAHCCYFRHKVWLRTPGRQQQLPASSLLPTL